MNITLDTYSHVLPGLRAAAAEALDTILAEPALAERPLANRSNEPSPAPDRGNGGLVSSADVVGGTGLEPVTSSV